MSVRFIHGVQGVTYLGSVVFSGMAIPILGHPARLAQEDEGAGVNGKPPLLSVLHIQMFQVLRHRLAVDGQQPRVVDAVKLCDDHARQRHLAIERVGLVLGLGSHVEHFRAAEPRVARGMTYMVSFF